MERENSCLDCLANVSKSKMWILPPKFVDLGNHHGLGDGRLDILITILFKICRVVCRP